MLLRHLGGHALSGLKSSSSNTGMESSTCQVGKDCSPHAIRWRKGELIGAGAYGRVYMGMNLESGELLAVKQVLISVNGVARDKAQTHIRELEEEVKLLRNLSHPNIVCYLGTAREQDALNIFLEFVPGGSIASLLGKFGSFPESVVRMYTRQLLQGLEYLHKNGIMHRDIKGANILVDNKGCIKLADFGASKQVAELATMSGAKSMKGTPYWMAPEVIRQTGHGLPADIWSVGCTVIEMATGKPPWSQQFQEVAALFHIGTTKSHPPIPEHLSLEAKDFLLKCLKKEPNLRPTSTDLLQHPFVVGEVSEDEVGTALFPSARSPCDQEQQPIETWTSLENSTMQFNADDLNCSVRLDSVQLVSFIKSFTPLYELSSFNPIQESASSFNPIQEPGSSFNPMYTPLNVWEYEGQRPVFETCGTLTEKTGQDHVEFTFPCAPVDDDDEVTESKIKAFLDKKALELKKLQTPLYEEFQNICNASQQNAAAESYIAPLTPAFGRQFTTSSKSPSKGSSLSGPSLGPSSCNDSEASVSSGSPACNSSTNFCPLSEVSSLRLNELRGLLQETQQLLPSPSILNSTERRKLWKEELRQELERMREEKRLLSRLGNNNSKSPSPKDRPFQRHTVSRLSFASPSRLPL